MDEKKIIQLAKSAREASYKLLGVSSDIKNKALLAMADAISKNADNIKEANKKDVQLLTKKEKSTDALVDRLRLDDKRIESMVSAIKEIAAMPDIIGEVMNMKTRPNGLQVGKVRVPIGVICIIYEARPNVTSDCAALTLKSSNAVILRGGSEAFYSNQAIFKSMKSALSKIEGLPEGVINFVDTSDRAAVDVLLKQSEYIDAVIPRGGESLIRAVTEKSTIPVIKHYKGVCHVYVDKDADMDKAVSIVMNAKVQRPAVCNAMETLLVHKDIAEKFLPVITRKLKAAKVELRGCKKTCSIITKGMKAATEEDWYTEYHDLILSVKVVSSTDAAIAHINKYSSHHSDAIITEKLALAMKFLKEVDSSAVFVNASTRFNDGGEFGLGAEMGISTDKLHARGPVGINELTTYKYIVFGNGQIRT